MPRKSRKPVDVSRYERTREGRRESVRDHTRMQETNDPDAPAMLGLRREDPAGSGTRQEQIDFWAVKAADYQRASGESYADWVQRLWNMFGDDFLADFYKDYGDDVNFSHVQDEVYAGVDRALVDRDVFAWEHGGDSADSYPSVTAPNGGIARMHLHVDSSDGRFFWRGDAPLDVFGPHASGDAKTKEEAMLAAEKWLVQETARVHGAQIRRDENAGGAV